MKRSALQHSKLKYLVWLVNLKIYLKKAHLSVTRIGNLERKQKMGSNAKQKRTTGDVSLKMLICSSLHVFLWHNDHFVKAHKFEITITSDGAEKLLFLHDTH